MKSIFVSIAILFIFTSVSFADLAPPKPKSTPEPKSVESRMIIRLDKNANEAVLKISKNNLKELRAQLDQIEDDSETSVASKVGFSRAQTIIGGMFLSLAFVFGGILITRNKKSGEKINKTIVAGAILFLVGSAATFVVANAGPPPQLRTISGKLFDKNTFGYWGQASGAIKIQVVETGNYVELTVPDKEEKINKDEE